MGYFSFFGGQANLIFSLFFSLVFFEASIKEINWVKSVLITIIAGFFSDIFSFSFFGISIFIYFLCFLILVLIFKFLAQERNVFGIFYFVSFFLLFYLFYSIVLYFTGILLNQQMVSLNGSLPSLVLSLLFGMLCFIILQKIRQSSRGDNQLKLF